MYLVKAFVVWLLIMLVESIHGTLRTLYLEPSLGSFRARQLSVFTGCVLFLTITYLFICWINAETTKSLFAIGTLWIILTLLFEFILVRPLLGLTWERALEDYDITRGGLMLFGILFMLFTPFLAAKLRVARTDKSKVL